MTDVQQALKDTVDAGPAGYRPPADPYAGIAVRIRHRRRRRRAGMLGSAAVLTGAVLAGPAAVAPVQDLFSGSSSAVDPAASALVRHQFTVATVMGETQRSPSADCPQGTVPDAQGPSCWRLGSQTRFVADAQLVREVDPRGNDVPTMKIVRLTLPPDATRTLRELSAEAGKERVLVALTSDGVVLHAPLFTEPFSGTTWDLLLETPQARSLMESWRR